MERLQQQLCATLRGNLTGTPQPIPEAGRDLMAAFTALSDARTWHAAGPNPIGYADIEAWCRLMRVPLQPQHVRTIRALDSVFIETIYQRGKAGTKALDPVARAPLSAELFDAMIGTP